MVRRSVVAALSALTLLALPATASATEPWVCMSFLEEVRTPLVGVEHDIGGTCSYDPDGHDLVKYEWDLDGDGIFETSTGATPAVSHTWTDRGAFLDGTVHLGLRITDSAGEVGEWVEPLRLTDTINSWFTFEPQLVNPGDVVDLNAFITPDEVDEREWTYAWDLDGDGSYEHSTGLLPHATMVVSDAIGPRAVGLRVTNDLNETSVIRRTIEVLPRHPSRDHIAYEAPKNLLSEPTVTPLPVSTGGPPEVGPAGELEPLPSAPKPRKPVLKKIDSDRYGMRLHYVRGPKWSQYRVTVSIPAKRAASYGLPRRKIVLARGTLTFDGRGVGRTAKMRWTKGAYRVFVRVRHSVLDIRGTRIR